MNDAKTLKTLNVLERHHGLLRQATERRMARQNFLAAVKDLAENGKIALVWSGRDCDCVQYTGQVELTDATVISVEARVQHTYEWADGPCNYYLERPSVAIKIKSTSRDLAMEAYEDGHPHIIYA